MHHGNRLLEHSVKVMEHQQQGGEQPLPVHPAVRGSQGGVLGSCKVSRLASMRRDLDEEHGEESRHRVERIMTEL